MDMVRCVPVWRAERLEPSDQQSGAWIMFLTGSLSPGNSWVPCLGICWQCEQEDLTDCFHRLQNESYASSQWHQDYILFEILLVQMAGIFWSTCSLQKIPVCANCSVSGERSSVVCVRKGLASLGWDLCSRASTHNGQWALCSSENRIAYAKCNCICHAVVRAFTLCVSLTEQEHEEPLSHYRLLFVWALSLSTPALFQGGIMPCHPLKGTVRIKCL